MNDHPLGEWMFNKRSKSVHYVLKKTNASLCGKFRNGTRSAEEYRPWDPHRVETCPDCARLFRLQIALERSVESR